MGLGEVDDTDVEPAGRAGLAKQGGVETGDAYAGTGERDGGFEGVVEQSVAGAGVGARKGQLPRAWWKGCHRGTGVRGTG